MGEGLRYNMQHMGDFIADHLERAFDYAKSSTKGISLTYDINDLEKKKRKLLRNIGERVAKVRRSSPELAVFNDEKMMALFSKLDDLEERVADQTRERATRLDPAGDRVEQFES